jgi:hypothetical protein
MAKLNFRILYAYPSIMLLLEDSHTRSKKEALCEVQTTYFIIHTEPGSSQPS